MTDQMIISALTGPTSSLLLLVGIGMAGWKFFSNTVVPATKNWVDKHLERLPIFLGQLVKAGTPAHHGMSPPMSPSGTPSAAAAGAGSGVQHRRQRAS